MASLRRPSHMPTGPGGKGPAPQSTLRQLVSRSGDDMETKRNARKSRVGDAIKRRMSMRYADPGQLFDEAPPLPPTHPPPGHHFLDVDPYSGLGTTEDDAGGSRFGQVAGREYDSSDLGRGSAASQGGAGEEGIRRRGGVDTSREQEWDFDELHKEGADVQSFIRRHLTGADADERKRFIAALQRFKQGNQREMQRNVFKHYAEFVNISKEISTLEHDMLELKELLGQWKDLPQLMGMDDTLAPTLDKSGNIERKRTMRNSVLDLQQVYKAQLTTLWSTVEGSQKYLPIAPGRHLVFETHTFVELNAATYKAKQSVSLFLLSDLLLIAGRRRTKTAVTPQLSGEDKGRERGRMVAERCWVLADLVVIDVKDSGDLTNALKIRRGKETCVYRTNRPEDKKSLLAAFRQVSQELSEKKRKESEKEQERRRTMWLGDSAAKSSKRASLLAHDRPLSTIGTSLADSKDLRWIDDFGDELTMAIATRNFDEAVEQVEKGKELLHIAEPNPTALSTLTARLDHLRATLIQSLAADLSYPDIRKSRTCHLVGLLVRLDKAQLARDSFLNARHALITKRVRAIRAEGDISLYVSELAVVCFTVVRNTGDWYMTAFKENKAASGFVAWAKEQIEFFSELFCRQVYAPNVGEDVVRECLQVTASHNRKLLKDVGLDFTFLLSSLLQPTYPSSPSLGGSSNGNARARPTLVIPSSSPGPTGYDINPSPFVNYSMGMGGGMGTPRDYGLGGEHLYAEALDPRGADDYEAAGSGSGSGGGRRTAPLTIKKASKEADRDRDRNGGGVTSPSSGLAPGEGRYRADMSRSGSNQSREGAGLR